jgi:hypothetical protein
MELYLCSQPTPSWHGEEQLYLERLHIPLCVNNSYRPALIVDVEEESYFVLCNVAVILSTNTQRNLLL